MNTSSTNRKPALLALAASFLLTIMLVMINIAQLWILAAAVDAALARSFSVLIPLIIASGVCFLTTSLNNSVVAARLASENQQWLRTGSVEDQ